MLQLEETRKSAELQNYFAEQEKQARRSQQVKFRKLLDSQVRSKQSRQSGGDPDRMTLTE